MACVCHRDDRKGVVRAIFISSWRLNIGRLYDLRARRSLSHTVYVSWSASARAQGMHSLVRLWGAGGFEKSLARRM